MFHKALKRFLKAIEKGEEFIRENEEEAIDIVSQQLEIDKEFVALVWGSFEFGLFLDQSILIILEDEVRWAMANNLTTSTEMPDFLNYIHIDALQEVKPGAVSIIH